MDIKPISTSSASCMNTIALIESVAQVKGMPVTPSKVGNLRNSMGYGVMSTPGLMIDGKVMHASGVPSRAKVEQWPAGAA